MDILIPIKKAAEFLGVSRRKVERLMAMGILLRPIKQGRGSFLAESDLVLYIERLKSARGK
jgi:hypothetical protein